MRKFLPIIAVLVVVITGAATAGRGSQIKKEIKKIVVSVKSALQKDTTIKKDSVIVKSDSVVFDSTALTLKKIPSCQKMYTIAKPVLGRWAKLFIVTKIEESGADGKNSWYALNYFNLTGMRNPQGVRKSTAYAIGNNQYAKFHNWYDCMLDWKIYITIMENKFIAKYKRVPKDEMEMIKFMHGSYNVYQQWLNDMTWLLNHFSYK